VHIERQAIVALRAMKKWKHEIMEDYYNIFLQLCVVIPQQPNNVYIRKTFKEELRKKLKLAIIRMFKTTIVKIANSTREIEEEMPTKCKSKQFQPLSGSENLNEESVNDEQKKEKRKNCKE